MSTFDTIKYHLSEPPTLKELSDLPATARVELLRLFRSEFPKSASLDTDSYQNLLCICDLLRFYHIRSNPPYHRIVFALRKYIAEL